MNELAITILQSNSIERVVNLVNSAYRGEASKKGWTTEADLLEGDLRIDEPSLRDLIQKPGAVVLTCYDSIDNLVGCVYLQEEDAQLYLGMLTVSPNAQGRGIGKQLLLAAEAHAKKTKCNAIIMNVISVRHELIAWYERHGYHCTTQTKPFPEDEKFGKPKQPLQFIILKKTIK